MHRRIDGKTAALRQVPLLAAASARDLHALAAAGDLVAVAAGHVLVHAGERPRAGLLVVEGLVETGAGLDPRREVRPGEVVGAVELLDGGPAPTDAVAVVPTTALSIPAPRLRSLLETNHIVRTAVLRQLARAARDPDPAHAWSA